MKKKILQHLLVSSKGKAPASFSSASTAKWDYDVLLCGGGVVGSALAAKLIDRTKGSLRIGIIEQNPPPSLPSCQQSAVPDIRVYALAPRSISFLKEVHAWDFMGKRSQPYTNMQIWESSGPGLVRFSALEMGAEELGRIAEDKTIQASLVEAIKSSGYESSVDFISNASVLDISVPKVDLHSFGPAEVTFEEKKGNEKQKRKVTARLVVGSDGANSAVRRMSGLSTFGWSYGVDAIVATLKVNNNGPTTAWQRYLPTGPLALLPLWEDFSSIVWSVPAVEAKRLKALSTEEFLVELNAAFQKPPLNQALRPRACKTDSSSSSSSSSHEQGPFQSATSPLNLFGDAFKIARGAIKFSPLGKLSSEIGGIAETISSAAIVNDPWRAPPVVTEIVSPRVSFPLQLQQASKYISNRVALIGDSAHSIHPQAGQGLNLGIQDANALAEVICQAAGAGQDIGDIYALRAYEKQRASSNLAMLTIVDTINRIFAAGGGTENDRNIFPYLRSLGMLGLHGVAPLKRQIAKFAMGI